MSAQITFIGGGNMAQAMVGGLLRGGHDANAIVVADRNAAQRGAVRALGNVRVSADNVAATVGAQAVVLAVKPQNIQSVCAEIAHQVRNDDSVIVSVAAGVTVASIRKWLGDYGNIVRVMPNTPALVGRGAAGLYAPAGVSAAQRERAAAIVAASGIVEWLKHEDDLHAVTAISGSGPAYFFLFMEYMEAHAQTLGLSASAAARLTRETAAGAAAMAQAADVPLAELRRRVTSPGGTTQAAINTFIERGLETLIHDAVDAARDRSIELAQTNGDD